MTDDTGRLDIHERLARLSREQLAGAELERARVTNPGSTTPAWLIRVVSLDEYNVYNVTQMKIGDPGDQPVQIGGSATKAVNIAEPFDSPGTIAAGTYAVMWHVGDRNVFYAKP